MTGDPFLRTGLQKILLAAIVALSVVAIGWAGVAGPAVAQEEPEGVYNVTEINTVDRVTIGDDLELETTITNTGNATGDQYISVRLDGPGENDFIAESLDSLVLDPGESETLTFSLSTDDFEEPGIGIGAVHTDDDAVGEQVEIAQAGADVDAYANDDGIVETDGLLDAIDDWQTGGIGTGLLLDVIEAWQSGESVL